jgi:hypothetical protein
MVVAVVAVAVAVVAVAVVAVAVVRQVVEVVVAAAPARHQPKPAHGPSHPLLLSAVPLRPLLLQPPRLQRQLSLRRVPLCPPSLPLS